MFDIQTLRVFIAVVETRGIRGAADRLSRTASAISLTLKQLEGEIGALLFEGGRKTLLTPLGHVLFDEARDLLAHYDRSRATVLAIARNENAQVEIACPPSVSVSMLSDIMIELAHLPLPVRVRARDMDSRTVGEAVGSGAIDVGIGHNLKHVPGVSFIPLFLDRLSLVCQSGCPLAKLRKPIAWKDLKDYPFLAHGGYGEIRDREFFKIAETAQVHLPTVMSLFALVKAGIGVTVLSNLLSLQVDSSIKFLPLADPKAHQVVGIISRDGYRHSPATASFLLALKQVIRRKHRRLGLTPLPRVN